MLWLYICLHFYCSFVWYSTTYNWHIYSVAKVCSSGCYSHVESFIVLESRIFFIDALAFPAGMLAWYKIVFGRQRWSSMCTFQIPHALANMYGYPYSGIWSGAKPRPSRALIQLTAASKVSCILATGVSGCCPRTVDVGASVSTSDDWFRDQVTV